MYLLCFLQIFIVMSEEDSGENLKDETSYEAENEQKTEELGCSESSEGREQETVPVTRKRPEPKPPSQPAATEKPASETTKVRSCACLERCYFTFHGFEHRRDLSISPHSFLKIHIAVL